MPLLPEYIEEFAAATITDNYIAAQSVACGEPVTLSDAVELAAASRALHNLTVLEGRQFNQIVDCLELWKRAESVFANMCQLWYDVPADGEALSLHRQSLDRFRDLCSDRIALYTVDGPERCRHATTRA